MTRIIYTSETGGVCIVAPSGELPVEEVAAKDVPDQTEYEIVEDDAVPSDRFFRNAWVRKGRQVAVDLPKAKEIGHNIRRQKRTEEFAPYDDVIAKQIPGKDAAAAEAARAAIRTKYELMQNEIDAAATPEEIKAALGAT